MCASTRSKRPISTFPIHSSVLGKLTSSGLITVGDLSALRQMDLPAVANLSKREAAVVWENIFKRSSSSKNDIFLGRSTLDILRKRQDQGCIVTFSKNLDSILDGGIHLGNITEICGVPGVGKTQLCMQLAVAVHIPDCLGGLAGEAVYIDTEGGLIAKRLEDMAMAVVQHCAHTNMQSPDMSEEPLTIKRILSRIHCFRCQRASDLTAAVHFLPKFLSQHSKVKLVVVDSIAAPFRSQDDLILRTRLLANLSQSLLQLASNHRVAVVLTNQMTTRIQASQSHLIPALGESWGHCCAMRLLLHWEQGKRWAKLYKSPQGYASCPFSVTLSGIRDAVHDRSHQIKDPTSSTSGTAGNSSSYDPHPPLKRQKKS